MLVIYIESWSSPEVGVDLRTAVVRKVLRQCSVRGSSSPEEERNAYSGSMLNPAPGKYVQYQVLVQFQVIALVSA